MVRAIFVQGTSWHGIFCHRSFFYGIFCPDIRNIRPRTNCPRQTFLLLIYSATQDKFICLPFFAPELTLRFYYSMFKFFSDKKRH